MAFWCGDAGAEIVDGMHFRVLTYNIHKGIGGIDRRYQPERIVEVIRHCAPDIVLLQEVDDDVPRSSHHRQVDVIGKQLELPHRAYQKNVALHRGHYGNAILSRFPLNDIRHLELTVPLKKRRRALVAHCRMRFGGHSHTVLLFNMHLGLAHVERVIQLKRFLNSHVLSRSHASTATIAAGDFNDVWGTLGKQVLIPAGFYSATGMAKTFPAFMPMRPLDRIFFRGPLRLDHAFVSRTKVAKQASDHLPLVADFVFYPIDGVNPTAGPPEQKR